MGDPARPVWEDGFVFPFSEGPAEHNPLQTQTQGLLGNPANWRAATRGTTGNDLGGYVLPMAFFEDASGSPGRARQGNSQSELLHSQFFGPANQTLGSPLHAQIQRLGSQFPSFGPADQPFSFTQTSPAARQGDSTFQPFRSPPAGIQPSLASRFFGPQSGNPRATPGDLTTGTFGLDFARAANLKFPELDFGSPRAESDWLFGTAPKFNFTASARSFGGELEAGRNTLSFAVEGKEGLTGPLTYKFGEEYKATGTNFSIATDGAHLSQLNLEQKLGPAHFEYEGNAAKDNKFTLGIGNEVVEASFNAGGSIERSRSFNLESYGGALSARIRPNTKLGGTFQQVIGEPHPSFGITITIGGGGGHSD